MAGPAVAAPPGAFGTCSDEDLAELDRLMAELRTAESDAADKREAASAHLRMMREKGATRRWLARRAGVADQTIGNMTNGRSD